MHKPKTTTQAKIRGSLQTQILFTIIATVCFIIFASGSIIIGKQKQLLLQVTEEYNKQLIDTVSIVIQEAMRRGDSAALKRYARIFSQHPGIAYAKFMDPENNVIAENIIFEDTSKPKSKKISKLRQGIIVEGKLIGSVEFGILKTIEQKSPNSIIFHISMLLLVTIVTLSLVLLSTIRKNVLKPVSQLAEITRAIGKGDLSEKPPITVNNELGELSIILHQMSLDLNKSKNDLIEANRCLKQLMEERVQRLKQAQEEMASIIIRSESDPSVRFENKNLQKCWEVKNCGHKDCPSYQSKNLRCWQVAGTFCGGEVQGEMAKKLGNCRKCPIFQSAAVDELSFIGEQFNNIMQLLEIRGRKLKKTQEQLAQSEKLASVGQLAAGVSHELNNPLGGILGYCQFILEKAEKRGVENLTPEELKDIFNYIGRMEHEGLRCKAIVENLLKFSRKSETELAELDINNVLEETFIFTKKQLEINNVELINKLTPDLPQIKGNEQQLQQVFTNLMINAQHAMPKGGKLTISTNKNNGFVDVNFADTGYGIPKQHLDKVFDPFFTTKVTGEGTGLGLSVSYGIIRDMGGKITVESEVGKGTTFVIRLPVSFNRDYS